MNIQIYGVKRCFDTRKAEMYFKERKIKYQYVDLLKYGLSKGEFQSVKASVGISNLINVNHKDYQKLNLHLIKGSSVREEILLKNPQIFVTPIVRNGKKATAGYCPEVWKEWE